MKNIILLLTHVLLFSQQSVVVLNSLDQFFAIKDQSFYFVYEINSPLELNRNYGWMYLSDKASYPVHQLKSKASNQLVLLNYNYETKKIRNATLISNREYFIGNDQKIYFAGEQTLEKGYAFLEKLVSLGHKHLASFYAYHNPEKAFSAYKKIIENKSDENRKDAYYWLSHIRTDEVFNYLNQRYDKENEDLKKTIIFSYRHFGKKGFKKLISLAKGNSSVSKEARFWLANSAGKEIEKKFNDEIYSKDDISLKESAIFSLYNMNDLKRLKTVVSNAKDIRLRKKALFWLGQSNDVPIEYFEEFLNL